jgi:hypothetical protein
MAGETLQGMKVAILVTEAVVDGNLVTSRKPDDIPAFTREMIKRSQPLAAVAGRPKARRALTRIRGSPGRR